MRVKRGDPNLLTVYNTGFLGKGEYSSSIDGNQTKSYTHWNSMLFRCYNKKYYNKYPTYKDCTVIEEWHNFQNFAKWFEENYNPDTMQGWHLDKDILVKGNRIYGPDTCCFIPHRINNILNRKKNRVYPTGVQKRKDKFHAYICTWKKTINLGYFTSFEDACLAYKIAKEKVIQQLANEYQDTLNKNVYNKLINYQIEIDR